MYKYLVAVNNHYMKKISIILIMVLISAFLVVISACTNNSNNTDPMLRFHIRANSNSVRDQNIKLQVRDAVLDFLEPKLENTNTLSNAVRILERESNNIIALANRVLTNNGFNYTAAIRIANEFFPSRMYGDTIIESGYFQAVIIELGSGNGDNWWCVLYPPLCYLEARGSFRYRSLILDTLRRWFA